MTLGLIIDLELGNIVKANRFGYIKRACHGTELLSFEKQRETYSRVVADLAEPRWVFIDSLFGLSEACLYSQLVDLLDAKRVPEVIGYRDLHALVRGSLDACHMAGTLKAEILSASSYDKLVVTGTGIATLNGTVDVANDPGYSPAIPTAVVPP